MKKKKTRIEKIQSAIMLPALIAGVGLIYVEFVIGAIKGLKKQHTPNTTSAK